MTQSYHPAIQIPMDLTHNPSFDPADYIVTSANQEAFDLLQKWPSAVLSGGAAGHALTLVGPEGAGKSHLGYIWASRVGARLVRPGEGLASLGDYNIFIVEDADRAGYDDVQLFHIYNWARERGGAILFTARRPPVQWSVALPDLASRIKSMAVAKISEPDDILLQCVMAKLFADRQLLVEPSVIAYAAQRMERRFDTTHRIAARADRLALEEKRKVSMRLMRRVLDEEDMDGRSTSTAHDPNIDVTKMTLSHKDSMDAER